MAPCDTHIVNLLNTVHHEMDRAVHSHHVYKTVWTPLISEQLVMDLVLIGHSTQ